ncbi:hypothetical protein ASE99_11060 [Serratia sp. Leaf51]|nr:hypothetical protein ASE99_11060 [Serratia sp. Leaf51]
MIKKTKGFEMIKIACDKIYRSFKPFSIVNISFYFIVFLTLVAFVFFVKDTLSYGFNSSNKLLALVGIGGALMSLIYNIRRHLSEDYYKEAKAMLEKAFLILSPHPDKIVMNDRMVWITCARMLLAAERIGDEIIIRSHKRIYEEDKQFWRVKFFEVIKDFPAEYYNPTPQSESEFSTSNLLKIYMPSVFAIHNFMRWDDNYIDPLKEETLSPDLRVYIFRRYPNLKSVIEASEHAK